MEESDNRHYAVINAYNRLLTLKYNESIIAKTDRALIVKEVGKGVYDPVFYLPKEDIKIEIEQEPARQSSCPIKGDATYWNLSLNPTSDYFAWSYETPHPKSKKIEGYIAFNGKYISFISEPIAE